MVAGFNFRMPQYQLQPGPRPQAPVWGPPDVAQMAQQGIGGLGKTFQDAQKNAQEFSGREAQAKALMDLAGPGGAYSGGQGGDTLLGGTGGGRGMPQGSAPSFAGGGNTRTMQMPAGTQFGDVGSRLMQDIQKDFGLDAERAAGIVGPLAMESGGFGTLQEVKPTVPGSRGGFGYAQWTGPRRKQFEEFARSNNLDPTSYEANYGFFKHEMMNTPEGRILEKVRAAPNAMEAARVFTGSAAEGQGFLRPGAVNMDARYRWTQRALGLGAGTPNGPNAAQVQQARQSGNTGLPQAQAPVGLNVVPQGAAPQQRDPRVASMTREEIVAQDQARGVTPPPMPGTEPLQPSPADAQTATQVVQSNQQAGQQKQQQAKALPSTTFMGLPATPQMQPQQQAPSGNVPGVPTLASAPAGANVPDSRVMQMPPEAQAAPGAAPQAPAPQAPPQQPPQAAPPPAAPPAQIAGGGGQSTVAGGAGPGYGRVAPGGQGQISPAMARYLAAGVRAGDPQASALATQLLGGAAGGKPHTAEVGGVLYQMNPQTGEWVAVAGNREQKAPQTVTQGGRTYQWTGNGWAPITAEGGGPQPLTPADRQRFGLPDTFVGYIDENGNPKSLGPQSQVTIENKAESARAAEEGKGKAQTFLKLANEDQARLTKSAAMTPQLDELQSVFARAGNPGAWADAKVTYGPYLEALGIDVNGLDDAQVAAAVVEKMVIGGREPGTGTWTDADAKAMRRAVPNLTQTEAGRASLLALYQGQNAVDEKLGDLSTRYLNDEIDSRAYTAGRREVLKQQAGIVRQFKKENAEALRARHPTRPDWDGGLRNAPTQQQGAARQAQVPQFATEADAKRAFGGKIEAGTQVIIGGKLYEWKD